MTAGKTTEPDRRRRFTSAHALALVALVFSLGGTVYAANKINGKKIKNESIAGNKLKKDTVGGGQIDEGSLGKVPSAAVADSARSADSAQTLQGSGPGAFVSSSDLKRFRFDETKIATTPDISRDVLTIGPLTLTAVCDFGGFPGDSGSFTLRGSTTAPNAAFDAGFNRDASGAGSAGGALGAAPATVLSETVTNGSRRLVGNVIYNDATTTVTVPFALFLNDTNAETRCFFTGNAARATG